MAAFSAKTIWLGCKKILSTAPVYVTFVLEQLQKEYLKGVTTTDDKDATSNCSPSVLL